MSLDDAKTLAEIAALVLAGIWAVFGLLVFRRRQAAVTELRKAEAEAATLELTARRRAVLDITIQSEWRPDADGAGYVVFLQVLIANAGVAPARMVFEEDNPAFRIDRVRFDQAGAASPAGSTLRLPVLSSANPANPARSRVVRAGGTSRLNVVFRVAEAGVYVVSFRAPMDERNREAMIEAGSDPGRRPFWSASTYVFVGYPPAPA